MASFSETPKINLRLVGFCGADDSVAPELLQLLSVHYTWIEWGFLFRPDLEGTPRYPSSQWIQRLVKVNNDTGGLMRLAGHLCGFRCQQVLDGDFSFIEELKIMGFGRIQINATKANNVQVDQNQIEGYIANIKRGMLKIPEIEWIIQCNDETKAIWEPLVNSSGADVPLPSNMSILFDASCGLGKLIQEFPEPLPHIQCGYAGGIGPHNIESTLSGVAVASRGRATWIDMESSLRVKIVDRDNVAKDSFSIDKCFECVIIASKEYGLHVSRFTLLSI